MSDSIGVSIIGTGMWARRLISYLRRTPHLHAVNCFSPNTERREAFAAEFECEAAPSFEAAIEHPEVQGVLLLTPNHIHATQTIACAQRGKHVFVEKPIADIAEDGRAMRDACDEAGVTLMVGHAFRRLGAARKVKELIDDGALGRVVLAEANFSLPSNLTPDRWRYYRETCAGGPLMQLGVHHADTLQYWLGPVKRVSGSFAHLVTHAEIDDVGMASFEFENGAQGVLTGSYVSPKTFWLRLYGTEANLHYETDMNIWPQADKMDPSTTLTLQRKSERVSIDFPTRNMLTEELEEFAACVRGETVPETGAAEALAALALIQGAIHSHERGQPQSTEEI